MANILILILHLLTEKILEIPRCYELGSLSHFINDRAAAFQDLPGFPEVAPDPSG